EEVAAVEGAGDGLQRVVRIRELVRRRDAAEAFSGGQEEAVGRTDVDASLRIAESEGAASTADAGVDDGEVDPGREIRECVRERDGSLEDVAGADSMGDVDDPSVRGNRRDHAVAGADEVVAEAEVGE